MKLCGSEHPLILNVLDISSDIDNGAGLLCTKEMNK